MGICPDEHFPSLYRFSDRSEECASVSRRGVKLEKALQRLLELLPNLRLVPPEREQDLFRCRKVSSRSSGGPRRPGSVCAEKGHSPAATGGT